MTGVLVGPNHVPVPFGDPPNTEIKGKGPLVLHTVMVPFVPAFGAMTRTTWTTADLLAQGAVP